uniref:Uncharacterized protein n=1 Tax=Arundo donax TaxID=35708 RepID=A0A0A8Z5F8_ARUDO
MVVKILDSIGHLLEDNKVGF